MPKGYLTPDDLAKEREAIMKMDFTHREPSLWQELRRADLAPAILFWFDATIMGVGLALTDDPFFMICGPVCAVVALAWVVFD
jgi:hypothetical protein